MLTKDHTKWNFEVLHDLIEGPLLNPKRMEEAIKVSRFIRRLLSFFHPFSHRFSDMEKDKVKLQWLFWFLSSFSWTLQINQRWIKLGCSLMSTLMASADGIRFLSTEDLLLKQLTKSFAQLDPVRISKFILCFVCWLKSTPSSMGHPRRTPSFLRPDSAVPWPTAILKCLALSACTRKAWSPSIYAKSTSLFSH